MKEDNTDFKSFSSLSQSAIKATHVDNSFATMTQQDHTLLNLLDRLERRSDLNHYFLRQNVLSDRGSPSQLYIQAESESDKVYENLDFLMPEKHQKFRLGYF